MEELGSEILSKKLTRKQIFDKFVKLDEKEGRLSFLGFDNIASFPASMILDMYGELTKITGKAARGLIVRAARTAGRKEGERIKNLDNPITAAINILTIWSALGWGRARLEREGNSFTFTFDYSFEGKNYWDNYGESKEPMCWIAFGYIWGLFEGVLDKEVIGEEKNCMAKGDKHCVFEFRV